MPQLRDQFVDAWHPSRSKGGMDDKLVCLETEGWKAVETELSRLRSELKQARDKLDEALAVQPCGHIGANVTRYEDVHCDMCDLEAEVEQLRAENARLARALSKYAEAIEYLEG